MAWHMRRCPRSLHARQREKEREIEKGRTRNRVSGFNATPAWTTLPGFPAGRLLSRGPTAMLGALSCRRSRTSLRVSEPPWAWLPQTSLCRVPLRGPYSRQARRKLIGCVPAPSWWRPARTWSLSTTRWTAPAWPCSGPAGARAARPGCTPGARRGRR